LFPASGTTIVPLVPKGALTRISNPVSVVSHEAVIVPHGVGTRPLAYVKLTVRGAKDQVE
jgi:hypothetical protein